MRRLAAAALLIVLAAAVSAGASPAAAPATLDGFTAWASAGSRLAFVAHAAFGRRGYLWAQSFGGARPTLLRTSPPVGEEEVDELAAGPNGSWAALERTADGAFVVDVVSSRGGGAHVAAGGSIAQLVGDGTFLGYLVVTPAGVVQLYRIVGAQAIRVASLPGVSAPQEAAVANGDLALREQDGTVAVFTLSGRPLATIAARAASVALTANRVVVRTRDRRLRVYGLRGGLVHDWPLAARSWTAGLGAYGRYAVYLGANKALHAMQLSDGRDRVLARAGTGWFFDGLSLQAPGAVVPLTTQHGTTLRFLPMRTLVRAFDR